MAGQVEPKSRGRWLVVGIAAVGLLLVLLAGVVTFMGARPLPRDRRWVEGGGRSLPAPPPSDSSGCVGPDCVDGPNDPSPVDKAMDRLRRANLAFNVPREMALGEVASLQLLLSPAHSAAELEALVTAPGEKQSAPVRASNRMEARLVGGEDFEVTTATPEEQAISTTEPTEWRWSLTPKRGGVGAVTLSVTAVFPLEGTSVRRSLRVFERDIRVKVSFPQRVATFVEGNWQWLWTTFLTPIGIWLWARWRKAHAPAPPTQ